MDRKRIILLYSTVSHTTAFYYLRALKKLDVDLVEIPFDPHEPQPERTFPEGDLLLLIDCGLPVEFPGMERFKGLRGYVSIDSCHKLDIHRAYCRKYAFDRIWAAQKHVAGELGPEAVWLPLAADEDVHVYSERIAETEARGSWRRMFRRSHYDIGMCGAPYKHRRRFEKLFRKAGLSRNFHYRKMFGEDATRETAKCTIGFNVGAGFTGEKGMDVNMRVFETMANGKAMLLTNVYDGLGFEDLFEEGRHYIGFRTEEEAVEKALYYAGRPGVAAKIAGEGMRHVLANHTYVHRCKKILSGLS